MPTKKCKIYKTPEGKDNPNCEVTFHTEVEHYNRRPRCTSCQRLKDNEYHKNYLRKRREEQRIEAE